MFLRRLFGFLSIGNNSPAPKTNGASKQKQTTTNIPGKQKRDRIPKHVRDTVWTTYHQDKIEGLCYACGITVQRYNAGWHCSHVLSDAKGGQEIIENLRVCCQHCNLSMGDQNLYTYIRDKHLTGPGSRNVRSYLYRHPSQQFDKRTNNFNRKKLP